MSIIGRTETTLCNFLEEDNCRDCFYLCQKQQNNSNIAVKQIQFDDREGFKKCGLWYAPIDIKVSLPNRECMKGDIENIIVDYALLVPCISPHEVLNSCYTVITKSWKTRITSAKLSFPALSFDFISSTIQTHLNGTF